MVILNRIGQGANAVKVLSPEETENPCASREIGKIVGNREISFFLHSHWSARSHLLGKSDPLLGEQLFSKSEVKHYRAFMKSMENQRLQEQIRRETRLGKSLGDGIFCESLSIGNFPLDCS
jgi:hypothetical protein